MGAGGVGKDSWIKSRSGTLSRGETRRHTDRSIPVNSLEPDSSIRSHEQGDHGGISRQKSDTTCFFSLNDQVILDDICHV